MANVTSISLDREETIEERLTRLNDELRDASAQTVLRASILREWVGAVSYTHLTLPTIYSV